MLDLSRNSEEGGTSYCSAALFTPILLEITVFIALAMDSGSQNLQCLTAPGCFTSNFQILVFHPFLAVEDCFHLGTSLDC